MNILNELEIEFIHTPETTLLGKIKNIIAGVAVYIVWATAVLSLYKLTIPEFSHLKLQFYPISEIYTFISVCIFTPFFEEFLFRTPLLILKGVTYKRVSLWAILVSSVIFGYAHYGLWSIPVQGVGGIIFCYVYLKNGYSYISSVIMHSLINLYFFLT